jgi:G3E family GTPase
LSTQQPIPAIILTGFLGSGKTTLLNRLLSEPSWSDSAVVINEFGDIGLDHLLVAEAKDNIVLMDSGCLCCAVLDSVPETLAGLFHRRAAGLTPPFRRLLVETSGLAEPGPILRTLMRDPLVSHFYSPQGLVCVVDAVSAIRTLAQSHEAQEQVAMADRLVVTKTDLTGGACPPELTAQLRRLNPTASIVTADRTGCVGALFDVAADISSAPWLSPLMDEHPHHHHDADIGSVSFLADSPITWPDLAVWIDHLRARYGVDLLRCKGILNVAGVPGPVVLHGVQAIYDTLRRPAWPDDERRSRIVLIGRGLDSAERERSLSLLNPEPTP